MYDEDTTGHCAADTHCKAYDRAAGHPAWTTNAPLCDTCLTAAGRHIDALLYAWYDLEQLQAPTLSQALNTQPGGRPEPPMPLSGEPEALQREIHHVLTTWETVVREHTGLPDLTPPAQHGAAVQRAITILTPRLPALARIGPTTVYPTGCEDPPADVTGVEAIDHLTRLRRRARAMLGWTRRTYWIPGDCWACEGRDADDGDGPLYRGEPDHYRDPVTVWCDRCEQSRRWDDYEAYLTTLQWPGSDEWIKVAA